MMDVDEPANNNNSAINSASDTPTTVSFLAVLPPPPRAAQYLSSTTTSSSGSSGSSSTDPAAAKRFLYWDRSHYDSPAAQLQALKQSTTVYVGNLAFTTRSRHVRAHFGTAVSSLSSSSSSFGSSGRIAIRAIHMGLDRLKKTPCGFCFVEFTQRDDALAAVAHISGTKLDGRVIRVELDAGFQPGRQYGRGVSGGQVRDDKAKKNVNQPRGGSIFSSMTMERKRPRTESSTSHPSSSGGVGSGEGLPAAQGDERGDTGDNQEASRRANDGGQEKNDEREQGGGGDHFDEDNNDGGGGDDDDDGGEPAAKRRRM